MRRGLRQDFFDTLTWVCCRMRGSHKMGRLDSYQEEWGERHIHPRRIELAIKAGCEAIFCEQDPGDCLFFHCE